MYMDPQKLSQLDPKLREAYQRVMGMSSAPPPPPAPQPEPNSTPTDTSIPPSTPSDEQPTIQPSAEPQPATPAIPTETPTIPAYEPVIPPQPSAQPVNFDQMNSEVASSSPNFTVPESQIQTMVIKKKSSIMPILLGVVIFIFIAVYILVWTKIFNLKLTFIA